MSCPALLLRSCPVILTSFAFATTASAQFIFAPAVNTVAGTNPSGVAAADFDGDGDRDLATTVDGPDSVVVLLNDGSGSYTVGPTSPLGSSSSPQDVIAGDFDADGDMDLAVAVRDPAGSVVIMANGGAGVFTVVQTIGTGDRPRGLSKADHDGDGDLDLAVANRDANTATVLTNTAGIFSATTVMTGVEPRSTAFADIDDDGDLDLAVTNHEDRTVGLFSNTDGAFSASGTLSVGSVVRPDGIVSADLDGDGRDDLAVSTSDDTLNIHQATIFLNTVTAFNGPFNYPTGGTNPSGLRAADLDCDGMIDLALVNQDSDNVSLLRNTGSGVFGAPQLMAAGPGPDEIDAADLDGDGDDDLAIANSDSNSISVMINQTCMAGIPGDANGDGVVNFGDILAVLGAWGDCPGCPEDLNGDGVVNFADILVVLSNWS